jgi:hypothetical protein
MVSCKTIRYYEVKGFRKKGVLTKNNVLIHILTVYTIKHKNYAVVTP